MLTKITTVLSFVIFVVLFSWQVWIASMQPHDDKATSYRDQSATKEIKPQSADERIALYTEWLAAFTGLLAVVSAVQGIFLFRADKTARISADAARAAAEAAGDAVQLGRDEFNASHRPKVRVREIEIATDENYTSLSLTPGNIVRARLES